MKYLPIDKKLFIRNRDKFVAQMKPGSLAIFHSNDIMPTNADGHFPFRQNNDLYYLTGIDQEDTFLILFPTHPNKKHQQILFIRESNEHIVTWEGHKLSKEQASQFSGIETVFWSSQFDQVLSTLIHEAQTVYLNSNEHSRAESEVETRDMRFAKKFIEQYPLHTLERSAPILHAIRAVKEKEEVEAMRTACDITEKAFRKTLAMIRPGVKEYEIEAEIHYEFLKNRSRGPAYASIIASGADACILHYVENDKECKDGDLILMDFGAEYANYNADLTRTVPVNGKFSARQKEVYNAVLRILNTATTWLVPGNTYEKYNKAVAELMQKELIGLGLLKQADIEKQDPEKPLYRKYFPHGISHFLGLDVHDVGNRSTPFTAGMVFTCEPGIYIREEGIGIRLENDILITEKGPVNLMESIPVEAEEIEKLMQRK